jgi:hypothetical protein
MVVDEDIGVVVAALHTEKPTAIGMAAGPSSASSGPRAFLDQLCGGASG